MKKLLNVLKTMILTGAIAIMTVIPTFAAELKTMDKDIINHYITANNEVVTVFKDNTSYINYDANIQSIDCLDNSIIIIKENGQTEKLFVEDAMNYYIDEKINITMDNNNKLIDIVIDNIPQVYYTSISQIEGNTACLNINSNSYSFENAEGVDGWQLGDKCKVIIQDGKLLEVRPIPLNER
jgi:hypothetical protein